MRERFDKLNVYRPFPLWPSGEHHVSQLPFVVRTPPSSVGAFGRQCLRDQRCFGTCRGHHLQVLFGNEQATVVNKMAAPNQQHLSSKPKAASRTRRVYNPQNNAINYVIDLGLESVLEDCNLGLKALFNNDLESIIIIMKLWNRTALYQPLGPPLSNYPPVIPLCHEQVCRILAVMGGTQTLYQKNCRTQMIINRQLKKNPRDYNRLSDGDALRELKSA
ncbi:unnamed protein product, partial [Iphiclides podalirius]